MDEIITLVAIISSGHRGDFDMKKRKKADGNDKD